MILYGSIWKYIEIDMDFLHLFVGPAGPRIWGCLQCPWWILVAHSCILGTWRVDGRSWQYTLHKSLRHSMFGFVVFVCSCEGANTAPWARKCLKFKCFWLLTKDHPDTSHRSALAFNHTAHTIVIIVELQNHSGLEMAWTRLTLRCSSAKTIRGRRTASRKALRTATPGGRAFKGHTENEWKWTLTPFNDSTPETSWKFIK